MNRTNNPQLPASETDRMVMGWDILSKIRCGPPLRGTDVDARPGLTANLVSLVQGGRPVLIRGTHRIGKTSAANLALNRLDGDPAFYCSQVNLVSTDSVQKLEADLRREVTNNAFPLSGQRHPQIALSLKEPSHKPILEALDGALQSHHLIGVLHFDETIALQGPAFQELIRQLSQSHHIRWLLDLHYVAEREEEFASSISQVAGGVETRWVRPLSSQETEGYVRQVLAESGASLGTDGTITDWIYQRTGGRPIEIDGILWKLAAAWPETQDPPQMLGLTGVERMIEGGCRVVERDALNMMYSFFGSYKRFLAHFLSDQQRAILRRLADHDDGMSAHHFQREDLEPLQNVGWVEIKTMHARIVGTFLRDLIRRDDGV